MTTAAFKNRSGELFGRQLDIRHLLGRCAYPGLTIVSGRPKIGKSWLLTEVACQLQRADHLVGYAESTAEQPDLLLRAVADAYARWLVNASATAQAKSLSERHKGNLIGRAGEAVGALFKEVTKLGGVEWKLAGELAAKSFAGLAALDRDLKSGGLALPRLSYEEARDLTQLLARLSGQGVVLILDAWEKTPSKEQEDGILDSYLHHLEEWPQGHVFLGLRVESDTGERVRRLRELVQGSPDAEEHRLSGMILQNEAESHALLLYARSIAGPAADEASDEEIWEWIDGYPGVLEWWGRRAIRDEVHSATDLASAASDAQVGRYGPEFERVLAPLYGEDRDAFEVAVRLALLPEMVDEMQWDRLRDVVLHPSGADIVTRLQVRGVLDEREPRFPSYGHSTRHDAAARWAVSRYLPSARQETEGLAVRLAASITSVDPAFHPHIFALEALHSSVEATSAPLRTAALVEAAACLRSDHEPAWPLIREALPLIRRSGDSPYLWSAVLFNTLNYRSDKGDRDGREALLAELRDLANRHPDDAAVREHLARALFNTHTYRSIEGDRDGREALLAELRELATRHPGEAVLGEQLAKAALNALLDHRREGERNGREALLAEVLGLSTRHLHSSEDRRLLAKAFINTLDDQRRERDRDGREALLVELRKVARRHAEDAALREQQASVLNDTLIWISYEGDLDGCEAVLAELRDLASRHPEDAVLRERLAWALYALIDDADRHGSGGDPTRRPGCFGRRAALLAELRNVIAENPDHESLRDVARAVSMVALRRRARAAPEGAAE